MFHILNRFKFKLVAFFLACLIFLSSLLVAKDYYLIPMDGVQNDHLKAYGVAYHSLSDINGEKNVRGFWLLNYRGGAFLFSKNQKTFELLIDKDVTFEEINEGQYQAILKVIKTKNMAVVKLVKAPKVAIYTPPNVSPWADAVTLVMTYAEIPYTPVYDDEIFAGKLSDYDWVHLHHEDFTGQYSKFWYGYRNTAWFKEKVNLFERSTKKSGYASVSGHKKAVARKIREAVNNGVFMFAMCTATETIDIALASKGVDVVPKEMDGTAIPDDVQSRLDFSQTFAFENFVLSLRVNKTRFSNIDYNQVNVQELKKEVSDFILFDFSAKLDPIPTLLTQDHERRIKGFYGQTTTFNPHVIKDGVTILSSSINQSARYITGKLGKGYFSFYGGHEPEDKQHFVGDKEPNVAAYKNSPGYRLILNNLLFPSAKPPPKKT